MICIIIDDDSSCISSLELMLKKYYPKITEIHTAQTIDIGIEQIQKYNPDLVFLDIEMNGESGFDLFLKIPKPEFAVIFATSHDKYMQNAIKNACFDYLLKPIDTIELVETLNRLEIHIKGKLFNSQATIINSLSLSNSSNNKIAIPTSKGYVFLATSEIVCCFADGKYTVIHSSSSEKITSTKNIGEFEEFLDNTVFFRTHRSWIINLKNINSFSKGDGTIILSNGMNVDLASRKKEDFLKLFNIF